MDFDFDVVDLIESTVEVDDHDYNKEIEMDTSLFFQVFISGKTTNRLSFKYVEDDSFVHKDVWETTNTLKKFNLFVNKIYPVLLFQFSKETTFCFEFEALSKVYNKLDGEYFDQIKRQVSYATLAGEFTRLCPKTKVTVHSTMAKGGRGGGTTRCYEVNAGIKAIKGMKIDTAFKCAYLSCGMTDKKPSRVFQHIAKCHLGLPDSTPTHEIQDYLNCNLKNPTVEKVFVQRLRWSDGSGNNKLFPVVVPEEYNHHLASYAKSKTKSYVDSAASDPTSSEVRYGDSGPGGDPFFENQEVMKSIAKLASVKYKLLTGDSFCNVGLYQDFLKCIIINWFIKNRSFAEHNTDHLERAQIDFRVDISEETLINYAGTVSEMLMFGIVCLFSDRMEYCGEDVVTDEDMAVLGQLFEIKTETKALFGTLLNLLEGLLEDNEALSKIVFDKEDLKLILSKSRLINSPEMKEKFNSLVAKLNLSLRQNMLFCDIIGKIFKCEMSTTVKLNDGVIFGYDAHVDNDDNHQELDEAVCKYC